LGIGGSRPSTHGIRSCERKRRGGGGNLNAGARDVLGHRQTLEGRGGRGEGTETLPRVERRKKGGHEAANLPQKNGKKRKRKSDLVLTWRSEEEKGRPVWPALRYADPRKEGGEKGKNRRSMP